MRFGICFNLDYHPEVHGTARDFYNVMLDQTVLLERLGYDSAWYSEHHSGPYSFGNPALMIAAAAGRTSTIKLGTGVSLLPLHHPLALSEEYAMLDQLSNGRLEYGIGRGYLMHEYPWLGIDASESTARYREAVEFITQTWTSEGPVNFEGQFYNVNGYTPFPSVVQKPMPPIYSSAVSPDSYTFAGEKNLHIGVALFVPGITEGLAANIAAYEGKLADSGFTRANREIMGITQMYCGRDEATAVRRGAECAKNYFNFFSQIIENATGPTPVSEAMKQTDAVGLNDRNQTLFGTPQQLVDKIGRMRDDWGIDYLQLEVAQGACDPSEVEDVMALFGEEVIPHFKSSAAVPQTAAAE